MQSDEVILRGKDNRIVMLKRQITSFFFALCVYFVFVFFFLALTSAVYIYERSDSFDLEDRKFNFTCERFLLHTRQRMRQSVRRYIYYIFYHS